MSKIVRHKDDIIPLIANYHRDARTIGFVPTMGALHDGHLSLVRSSRQKADITIVSIFVNPLQFNDKNDFEKYPVQIDKDIIALESEGVDVIFLPEREELFSGLPLINMEVPAMQHSMEGLHRPGHFEGVLLIISKFFNIISPDFSFFGEKDFQQLRLIEQLVNDLDFRVQIVRVRTKREKNGLALSSRNSLIRRSEFQNAGFFYAQLREAKSHLCQGESLDKVKKLISTNFAKNECADLEYFEIADEKDLEPISSNEELKVKMQTTRLFIAGTMSGVRLIDNIELASK